MSQTEQTVTVKLTVPDHVQRALEQWSWNELDCRAEEMLETLAAELCRNVEVRQYAAELVKG